MEDLHRRAKEYVRSREVLDLFLSRYREFVALAEPHAAGGRRRTSAPRRSEQAIVEEA